MFLIDRAIQKAKLCSKRLIVFFCVKIAKYEYWFIPYKKQNIPSSIDMLIIHGNVLVSDRLKFLLRFQLQGHPVQKKVVRSVKFVKFVK